MKIHIIFSLLLAKKRVTAIVEYLEKSLDVKKKEIESSTEIRKKELEIREREIRIREKELGLN